MEEKSITRSVRRLTKQTSSLHAKACSMTPTYQLLASLTYPGDVAAIPNNEPLLCTHFGFVASNAHVHGRSGKGVKASIITQPLSVCMNGGSSEGCFSMRALFVPSPRLEHDGAVVPNGIEQRGRFHRSKNVLPIRIIMMTFRDKTSLRGMGKTNTQLP